MSKDELREKIKQLKFTSIHRRVSTNSLRNYYALTDESIDAILNLLEGEKQKAQFQLKANIFTMFNVAMVPFNSSLNGSLAALSPRPDKAAAASQMKAMVSGMAALKAARARQAEAKKLQ